jgi:hypothetical protein
LPPTATPQPRIHKLGDVGVPCREERPQLFGGAAIFAPVATVSVAEIMPTRTLSRASALAADSLFRCRHRPAIYPENGNPGKFPRLLSVLS